MTETQIKLVKISMMFMVGITVLQARAMRQLIKNYKEGQRRFENLREGTVYLLDIIHENNIDLTEFDVIALSNIFESSPNE